MTTPDRDDPMSADAILAMDYALGALGRVERRSVETRLRSDPDFAALVTDWQQTLSPLDAETAAVPVPAEIWQAISAEIVPAPKTLATAAVAGRNSLWNSLALWRSTAFAGVAAAIIAVLQTNTPPPPPGTPPKLLVASLAGTDGKPLLAASYDPVRGAVALTPAGQNAEGDNPADRDAELWVIEGDKPPRSLGVIDISGPNSHALSTKQLGGLQPGATLAISIEPRGGSRTGAPTGPVVATGKLSAI